MRNMKIVTGILVVGLSLALSGVVIASDTDEFTQYGMDSTSAMESNEASKDIQSTSPANEVERINPLFCTLELVDRNKDMMVNDCTKDDLVINRT